MVKQNSEFFINFAGSDCKMKYFFVRLKVLLATFTFLCTTGAFAQPENNEVILCGTDEAVRRSLEQHPALSRQMDELEAFTGQFGETSLVTRESAKIIPVVFHIIHDYGVENISRAQVLSALDIINADFSKQNADISQVIPAFSSIAADAGFEFRLARKDPNGNCTDGITRTASSLTFAADDNVKDLISWPSNKYLNIWVVDALNFSAGGYAYLPGSAPKSSYDGIVVIHRQLGDIGTSGRSNFAARTLTHEIGHWFNLSHTWGRLNPAGSPQNCNDFFGDGVNDTPRCIGVTGVSCNLSQNSCNEGSNDKVDNIQNYMDYSNCAIMFTTGQRNRMQAAANSNIGGRSNLWSASNLQATGVLSEPVCLPIVDFKASLTEFCPNTQISFSDLSHNAEINSQWQWNWSFPGGNPASSTQQHPVIRYSTPGSYPVTLTVTNSAGSSSKSKVQYIMVGTDPPALHSPYVEGFESSSFPENNDVAWRFEGNPNAFSRSQDVAATGSYSLVYRNSQVGIGTVSSFISPAVDFSASGSPARLSFKLAYARKSDASSDRLEIFISTNCGRTWSRRYSKGSAELATTGNISGTFIPQPGQWRTETVTVPSLAAAERGLVKFSITDGDGNNLYIDDIHLLDEPVGINDPVLDAASAVVFPNPGTSGNATISFDLLQPETVYITVRDIYGRLVASQQAGKLLPGTHIHLLSAMEGGAFSPGVYFIRVEAGTASINAKWVCNE